ncbi:MAG TPA: PAS domain S-box protein, partial [Burkholderiales bacterium]|nr:PAS domain S-box protein [Burkholderiales bacterium]
MSVIGERTGLDFRWLKARWVLPAAWGALLAAAALALIHLLAVAAGLVPVLDVLPAPARDPAGDDVLIAAGALIAAVPALLLGATLLRYQRVTAALRESRERLRTAIEARQMVYWEYDLDSGRTRWGPGAARLLGPLPAGAEHHPGIEALTHPDDRDAVRAAQRGTARFGAALDIELRLRRTDGGLVWVRHVGGAMYDDHGRVVRIVGTTRDISSRKTTESELRETQALLETIFENLPDMVSVKSADGLRFVRINRAGEALLGYSRAELIGKSDYDLLPQQQAGMLAGRDRGILARGEVVEIPEEEVRTRRNGTRYLHTKKIPIRGDDGRPCYLLGISADVTERRRAEAEIRSVNASLAQRTEQLTATNTELEAFAFSVSHDLRAPLRHIAGFVGHVLEHAGGRLDEDSRGLLGRVARAARRMERLIDDLLGFSRMARSELSRTTVDLGGLIAELVEEARTQCGERRIDWRIGALPAAIGDRGLLRITFANLIDNAVKYTGTREHAVIEIGSAAACPEEAVVYVRDNGVGFDMQHAHRLFGAFQRLHRADEFEGTGIGLANVQRIVARHGGRVWAESRQD